MPQISNMSWWKGNETIAELYETSMMLVRKMFKELLVVFCMVLGLSTWAAAGLPGCHLDADSDGDIDGRDLQQFAQQFDSADFEFLARKVRDVVDYIDYL
jgi:hypothetical protein